MKNSVLVEVDPKRYGRLLARKLPAVIRTGEGYSSARGDRHPIMAGKRAGKALSARFDETRTGSQTVPFNLAFWR
jgi:hypothetical protein